MKFDDLRLPVCVAPMFLVSGPELVIAACKAGVIGAFPTMNCRTTEALDEWMGEIAIALAKAGQSDRARPLAPWLVNVLTHKTNTRLEQDLALLEKYKPPLASTALGRPDAVIEVVHSYGGQVFSDVVTVKMARKALAAGADGLICVAAGAGGHTGWLSPFAFVSEVRRFFDGPLILAGGIADGRGVAAALVAGADLVCMGTRFISNVESIAHVDHKGLVLKSSIDDVVVSAGITGSQVSWLRSSLISAGYDPENMPLAPKRDYESGTSEKKRWKEIFSAGQGVGRVEREESLADTVDRLEVEFHEALGRSAVAEVRAAR